MKTFSKLVIIAICSVLILTSFTYRAEALSARHHLINAGKDFFKMVVSPFKGVLVTGPKNVHKAYVDEVSQPDEPELRHHLFGIWRAPGEELKGTIDGVVNTFKYGGDCLKEIISIPFSD
jgi:hypothetical protein